jgi:hypothetical protein
MNNFIIISRTYSETTPESAENGEFSDHGFITEKQEVSFYELMLLMEKHFIPSCSPNNGGTDVSYSTEDEIEDYSDGTRRIETIHFHQDNTPNAPKYWRLAALMCGHIK